MDCLFTNKAVKTLILYENKEVSFKYPDTSDTKTISQIISSGSIFGIEYNEKPLWNRKAGRGSNYTMLYDDTFTFLLKNDLANRDIARNLFTNRNGFIAEIQLLSGEVLVLKAPVFVNDSVEQSSFTLGFNMSMSYRVPTPENFIYKNNNLINAYRYLIIGDSAVLAGNNINQIISY